MKTMKSILIVLALMLAACLSVAALAENPAEAPADPSAADAAKSAIEEAQAAADTAQAETDALNEALEAYSKAKAESRRLQALTSLKEELDAYVAAGTLTQEQADLILKYCAEQMTLQQSGSGFGFGGKDRRGGKGPGRGGMNGGMNGGMDAGNNAAGQSNGFGGPDNGFGGKHGRFGNTAPTQPQAPEAGTEIPETQSGENPGTI